MTGFVQLFQGFGQSELFFPCVPPAQLGAETPDAAAGPTILQNAFFPKKGHEKTTPFCSGAGL